MNYQVNIEAVKDYMLWLYEMQAEIFENKLDELLDAVQESNKELKEISKK